MTEPTSPHDALVRAIFGSPALMAEELRAALPPQVAAQLDLTSREPEPARFVDAKLQGAESDLLFSAQIAGRPTLIYVLIEHQSESDRFMPLRLLRYIGRILDAHRRKHPDVPLLPAVLPIVLCHDRRPWPYPLDLGSRFDLPPDARRQLAPFLPNFRFLLDDLAVIDVDQLSSRATLPLVKLTLFVLKRARHAEDLVSELGTISALLRSLNMRACPTNNFPRCSRIFGRPRAWTTASSSLSRAPMQDPGWKP